MPAAVVASGQPEPNDRCKGAAGCRACDPASDTTVDVDSSWGGSKGFFSGAGLVLLR